MITVKVKMARMASCFRSLVLACVALGWGGQALAQTSAATIAARPQLSGERLFLQCRACHSLTSDQAGKVGPALGGIFTRGVGTYAGFDYSPSMKAFGGVWTDARLDIYLAAPNRTVAGTKMAFAGIPDAGRRAALIAYLRANTSARPVTK
jgi:cytochrome c